MPQGNGSSASGRSVNRQIPRVRSHVRPAGKSGPGSGSGSGSGSGPDSIREKKVDIVRLQIVSGKYPTDDLLEAAAERILRVLFPYGF